MSAMTIETGTAHESKMWRGEASLMKSVADRVVW